MSEYSLSVDNMMRVFPAALAADKRWLALGRAAAEQLVRLRDEGIAAAGLYTRLGALDEALLDIIAADYKIEWWDADYSVEEKRRTLANSWALRRILGSPEAVERAVSAIYPYSEVVPWEEYGGAPYHYKMRVDADAERAEPEKHARVLARMQYYQPARAYLDKVEYHSIAAGEAFCGAAVSGVGIHLGSRANTYAATHISCGSATTYAGAALTGISIKMIVGEAT